MIRLFALVGAAFLLVAPQAHADDASYLAYLNSHGTFFPALSDSVRIYAGHQVCTMIQQGQTPEQIASSPGVADHHGIVDAAQHELCPNTLH